MRPLARRALSSILGVAFAATATIGTPPMAHALVWPDVPERVERNLGSSDAATRRAAARDLATLGNVRATPLVLRALGDADTEVRLAAAKSAMGLKVVPATDVTLTWLGERDARLRVAACDVARALPAATAVPTLARALSDADPLVRAACAEALGAQGSNEATAALAGKLDDPTPAVRVQIARALAKLGDPRAIQALLLTLRDNAPEVKVEALGSLGRLRATEAAAAIAPLTLERNPTTRQAALTALGRIARGRGDGANDAVQALVRSLGTMDDASGGLERNALREALVSAGPLAVPELVKTLDRPVSPHVATSAAWILGERGATEAAPDIVRALRKGTLPPAAALRALAGAGTADQVPVVLEFVSDATPQVRDEAVRAATALLDPARPDGRAVEPLIAALRSPRTSPQSRAALATLLGRTGAARAKGELTSLVGAKDLSVRLAAIDALGALANANPKDPAGVADGVLVPLLGDTDPALRLRASVALARSGGEPAKKALLERLDRGEPLDRYATFQALGGIGARLPDEALAARLFRELGVSAGPERDAVIEAAGRIALPSTLRALESIARQPESNPDDRRTATQLLAAQRSVPGAADLVRRLTTDADPAVRAEAAFALGAFAEARDIPTLRDLAKSPEDDVAVNASASLARLGLTLGPKARPALHAAACALLADPRAPVRANAVTATRELHARCGDGATERKLLAEDPSELVRASAARVLAADANVPAHRLALDRCLAQERSAEVARHCQGIDPRAKAHGASTPVTVFIVGDDPGAGPKPRAPYLLEYEDGVVRAGRADRRGATFDPFPPAGTVVLRRPTMP